MHFNLYANYLIQDKYLKCEPIWKLTVSVHSNIIRKNLCASTVSIVVVSRFNIIHYKAVWAMLQCFQN